MTTFLKGLLASRPAASANPDTFYWASDLPTDEDMFFSDGQTWIRVDQQPFTVLEQAAISGVAGLTEALANFALVDHTHAWTEVTGKPATYPPETHGHAIADVTSLQSGLDGKAASNHGHDELPTTGQKNALSGTQGTPGLSNLYVTNSDARNSDARVPTAHTHAQSEVTNLTTDLAAKANLARVPNATYRSLLDCTGSHIAARVAGTYGFGQGQPLAISGTGTLYALNAIYLAAADYPTLDGIAAKLRVRAQLYVNDVAPTGNFTFGLHPITRPATSGGAGLVIYTIGVAVAGSTVAVNAPAADSSNIAAGADFALPADGHYVLGVVTTATVAASSHLHMSSLLQMRNA